MQVYFPQFHCKYTAEAANGSPSYLSINMIKASTLLTMKKTVSASLRLLNNTCRILAKISVVYLNCRLPKLTPSFFQGWKTVLPLLYVLDHIYLVDIKFFLKNQFFLKLWFSLSEELNFRNQLDYSSNSKLFHKEAFPSPIIPGMSLLLGWAIVTLTFQEMIQKEKPKTNHIKQMK